MNILIICVYYTDSNNANGICAKNIAEEMIRRGHKVWVISSCDVLKCEHELVNGVDVHYIESEDYIRKLREFRKSDGIINKAKYLCYRISRNIKLLSIYPNNSPTRSLRVLQLAKKLIEDNNIQTVLGTYRPYESLFTSIALKNDFNSNLNVITYHLDLLTYNDDRTGLTAKIMSSKAQKALAKELNVVDKMLVPENYFEGSNPVYDKMIPVGFPLYIRKEVYDISDVTFDKSDVNISYIGSLDKDNRNPEKIIRALSKCSSRIGNIKLHVWGKLWDSETEHLLRNSENVIYHGVIENRYVQDILQKSDILLNVSNALTYNFIPSKIFQYFALEKPIINFVQNENDCSLKYFQKYKRCFNYYSYQDNINRNTEIESFIDCECRSEKNSTTELNDIYERFTPSYICDIIES